VDAADLIEDRFWDTQRPAQKASLKRLATRFFRP
jgi:hypothetical protein